VSNDVADDEAVRLVERLRDATNSHDPDAVAACFTPDYHSETPLHPARSFTGRDRVRRNQEKIFTFVPASRQNCSAAPRRHHDLDRMGAPRNPQRWLTTPHARHNNSWDA
jgi:hypothetical protein